MPRTHRITHAVATAILSASMLLALAGCSAGAGSGSGVSSRVESAQSGSVGGLAPTASAGSAAAVSASATRAPASSQSQPYDASQLDMRVTQVTWHRTIGIRGWSKMVRPPSSATGRIKRNLMAQHHYTGKPSEYELDHFIPISLGGASTLSNLWLEPIAEAKLKDRDEAFARSNVLSGMWTLAQGQQYMRDHWRIHYSQ